MAVNKVFVVVVYHKLMLRIYTLKIKIGWDRKFQMLLGPL